MGKSKKSKQKSHRHDDDPNNNIEQDERFAAALSRPQFRGTFTNSKDGSSQNTSHNTNNKVVLDERFASVLTDPRFQLHEQDKYGRTNKGRRKKKQQREMAERAKQELGAFYTIVNDEDKQQQQHEEKGESKDDKDNDNSDESSTASSSSSTSSNEEEKDVKTGENDEPEDPASRIAYLTALSRGELDVSSSSEDDDGDEDDSDQSSDDDESSTDGEDPGTVGILDPSAKNEEQVEITYEDSPYLAVTNLDWAHVRAVDIFVILSSFTPPGAVKRVQVFLSDFGKEKMAQEFQNGPPSLWKKQKKNKKENKRTTNEDDDKNTSHDDDDEDDNQSETSSADEKKPSAEQGDNNSSDSEDEDDDDDAGSADDAALVDDIEEQYAEFIKQANEQPAESDFDPEKLRAYEASKLKYYFAVAEFTNAEHADICYKEVDGMEFEHSSAAVDMRSIPTNSIDQVIKGRELRDEATSIPGNYVPPDFIVSALQQTNVACSWEAGDTERERTLTKYTSAEQWASFAESDDLKAYLASDHSSDDEDSDNDSSAGEKNGKGSKLRKLLGLDNDSDGEDDGGDFKDSKPQAERASSPSSAESDDDQDENGSEIDESQEFSKEIKYVPGKVDLEQKIRTKLQGKEEPKELTPWEKFQEKRKQKRREKRQTIRRKRSDVVGDKDPTNPRQRVSRTGTEKDEFFQDNSDDDEENDRKKPSKEELELLLAGDDDEEVAKDFDMRGLRRIEKNKDKKLHGSRKRKEEKIAEGVSGQKFTIDLKDERFFNERFDDGKFGIDRTNPQYKETAAMREILDEQKARRKKKRKKNPSNRQQPTVPPNVNENAVSKSAGSKALSSLVQSLKTKVADKSQ